VKYILIGNVFIDSNKGHSFLIEQSNLLMNPNISGLGIVEIDTVIHLWKQYHIISDLHILNPSQGKSCFCKAFLPDIYGYFSYDLPVTIYFTGERHNDLVDLLDSIISFNEPFIIKFTSISSFNIKVFNDINRQDIFKGNEVLFSHHFSHIDRSIPYSFLKNSKIITMNPSLFMKLRKLTNRVMLDLPYVSYSYIPPLKIPQYEDVISLFIPSRMDYIKRIDRLIRLVIENITYSKTPFIIKLIAYPECIDNIKSIFEEYISEQIINLIAPKSHWYDLPNEYSKSHYVLYYGGILEGFGFIPFESLSLGIPTLALGTAPSVDYLRREQYPYTESKREKFNVKYLQLLTDVKQSTSGRFHDWSQYIRKKYSYQYRTTKLYKFIFNK